MRIFGSSLMMLSGLTGRIDLGDISRNRLFRVATR